MNQVAVVIGGGQTLGEFLCRGLAAEGYRVAVVDIQSDKASRVAQSINAEYGEGIGNHKAEKQPGSRTRESPRYLSLQK